MNLLRNDFIEIEQEENNDIYEGHMERVMARFANFTENMGNLGNMEYYSGQSDISRHSY